VPRQGFALNTESSHVRDSCTASSGISKFIDSRVNSLPENVVTTYSGGMLKFALQNLMSRPTRSLLSLLGLTVAIVAMVGLFSVAEGLDVMVTKTFGRITGLIAMQPGAPIPLFSRIPASWEEEIAAVEGISVVNAEIWQRANVIDEKTIFSPPRFLFGTDIETRHRLKHAVYREEIEQGRFLTLEDRGSSNAVISRQIAEEFHKGVGDTLQVNGYELTIVGIYHCGSLLLDVAIILDLEQVQTMTRFDPGSVSGFYIEQQEGVDDRELIKRIQTVFKNRKVEQWSPSYLGSSEGVISEDGSNLLSLINRGLKTLLPGNEEPQNKAGSDLDDGETKSAPKETPKTKATETRKKKNAKQSEQLPIEVRSAMDWAERFEEFSGDLDIFLTIMTAIGVTIAVLSIVNTMLMSVAERVIEFGILKANGWSKLDVLKLITFESATLGLGGGILGAFLGWVATQMINSHWPTRVNLFASPGLLLFSVFFSTALGILGGLYPAIWAMRMMPMDAIRRG
jgi:putative ABC transport system permease protein